MSLHVFALSKTFCDQPLPLQSCCVNVCGVVLYQCACCCCFCAHAIDSSNRIQYVTLYLCTSSAKPVVDRIRGLRLSMDDFEVLEVIGRGAFGEVKVSGCGKCLRILLCDHCFADILQFGKLSMLKYFHTPSNVQKVNRQCIVLQQMLYVQ